MEEACFSGYCRRIDGSRTVFCEFESSPRRLSEAGCSYPDCEYSSECPIAKAFLDAEESAAPGDDPA